MPSSFSAGQAARLSNLSEERVHSFARAGLVGSCEPAKRVKSSRFDFRDVALLKTAARLIKDGVAPNRVRRSLTALRKQLPGTRPLSSARVEAAGRRLVAHDEGCAWEPETGQMRFTFGAEAGRLIEHDGQGAIQTELSDSVVHTLDDLGSLEAADYWFDLAIHAEDETPRTAYEHYLRALACNPEHIESTINIGRLCSSAGDLRRAACYFRNAVRLERCHPVAQFNLAVTLHDLDDSESAAESYRAALEADPNFADAHFNLAALLDQRGDHHGAMQHLKAYERCRDIGSEP